MISVGILGTGFGLEHLKNYRQAGNVRIAGIFGRNREKLSALYKESGIETYTDPEILMRQNDIDVIDICLPTHLHVEYMDKASANGRHVLCETPLCCNRAELSRAAELSDRNICVSSFIKYIREYEYLKETIETGELGSLLHLRLKRYTPAIWGNLGLNNIVFNLMIHDLDFAAWIFGSPNTIKVDNAVESGEGSIVNATLSYGSMSVSLNGASSMPGSYHFTAGYEAWFSEGYLDFSSVMYSDGPVSRLLRYTDTGKETVDIDGIDPYFAMLADYISSVEEGRKSRMDLKNAVTALEWGERINTILKGK